jgi:hypothetical protein
MMLDTYFLLVNINISGIASLPSKRTNDEHETYVCAKIGEQGAAMRLQAWRNAGSLRNNN